MNGPDELDRWLASTGLRAPDLRGTGVRWRGERAQRGARAARPGWRGEVVAAWDSTLRRVVAVKVQSRVDDDRRAARLVREARIGGQLTHPRRRREPV